MLKVFESLGKVLVINFGVLGIMFIITWIIDKVCKKAGWDCDMVFDGFIRFFMYLGGIGLGIFGIAVLAMIGRAYE